MDSSLKSRIKSILNAVDLTCGCGRKKLPAVANPKSKPQQQAANSFESPSTSGAAAVDGKKSIITAVGDAESRRKRSALPRIEESVAVEKESEDPYADFRESIGEMVAEMGIESGEDMKELVRRFLDLNSPRHHDAILRASTDVFNFSAATTVISASCRT